MRVKELKERLAMPESGEQFLTTGRIVAYIIDGLEEINMLAETHINIQRADLTKDKRSYSLPPDSIKILDIRAKNHLNSKDEYRSIPRLIYEPVVHDADEGSSDITVDDVENPTDPNAGVSPL